jgi:hypothetical protein
VVSGKQFVPLGWVTFRDVSNYRIEMLAFELVDFSRPYHVILGWPCYVKFMAIPSYAYLKLKIPGPTGITTLEAKTQRTLDCEQDSIELVAMAELRELSLRLPTAPLGPVMPPMSGIFKMDKDAKDVQIYVGDPTKNRQIGASLVPK